MANATSVKVDGVSYPCEDTYAREQIETLNTEISDKASISISGTALVITIAQGGD